MATETEPVRVEKTRPNDTTAYAANDAICESDSAGTVWTFPVTPFGGGAGQIIALFLATNQAANVARYELDLYESAPTAINDNAEATRLYANQANFLGTITTGALAKKTSSSTAAEAIVGLNIPFRVRTLYGILRTLDAFTPAANQKTTITLVTMKS